MPGLTIACGDSYRDAWRVRSIAIRIGTSEVERSAGDSDLTTRSRTCASWWNKLPIGVTAKDIILAIIAKIGTAGGTGYVSNMPATIWRCPWRGA